MSIPANVLLDKDGKIIAKNLRGEDLRKKLAEVSDVRFKSFFKLGKVSALFHILALLFRLII